MNRLTRSSDGLNRLVILSLLTDQPQQGEAGARWDSGRELRERGLRPLTPLFESASGVPIHWLLNRDPTLTQNETYFESSSRLRDLKD